MNNQISSSTKTIAKSTMALLLVLSLARELAWAVENQYFNTFLYNVISPDPKAVSALVSITAVVSTLTAIFMGTLSDRTRTKWGKRKPFIVFGFIGWGIFTAVFPTSAFFHSVAVGVFMAILFDCLMTFFGATATDAALSAYVADVTTLENRGKVVGSMSIMTWVAMLIVYGGAGFVIQYFGYYTFFYFIGGIVFLIGCLCAPRLKEMPDETKPKTSYFGQIADTFKWKALTENKTLFLLLISLTLFMVAFNVFFPYLLIYMEHYLKLTILQSSIVLAVTILLGGIAASYPIGLLVDRWGRRPVAICAVICESIGLFAFSLAKSVPMVIISAMMFLIPYTAWTISTQTWTKDLFPEDKRGQFSGYYIFFNIALTMIPGPLLGGWLADTYGIQAEINGQAGIIPTPILFQVAAGMVLLTLIPLLIIKKQSK